MNNIETLNIHLFDALDRLMNTDLDDAGLDREIRRAEAVTDIADKLIHSGELQLKAMKHGEEYGYYSPKNRVMPELLEASNEKN